MNSDQELLRQFAEAGAEAAFAELVRRYAGLAYAAALRQLGGDATLAEDVAQSVFVDLARKAKTLAGHPSLAGWVHSSVRYAALRAHRDRRRRQIREQEAATMNETTPTPEIQWEQLAPVLDEAVASLAEPDREAVLLRFFQGASHREVAVALQLKEDAARMRVERALEKLRAYFARQGVKTSTALLSTALPLHAVMAVPADLGARWAGAAVAGVTSGGVGVSVSTGGDLKTIFTFKAGLALAAAAILALLVYWPFGEKKAASDQLKTANILSPNTTMITPPLINRGVLAGALLAAGQPVVAQESAPPPLSTSATPRTLAPAPPPMPAPQPPQTVTQARPTAAPPPLTPVPVSPDLVKANNEFAVDFFLQANPRPDANAFFSPYSISTALAMTWAGARGDTAAQMADALHFSSLPSGSVPASFGLLQQAVAQAGVQSGVRLEIANSVWPETDPEHPFSPAYLNLVQGDFGSALFPVDYVNNSDNARLQINAWVEEKTNNRIQELVHRGDVNAGTLLVLVNAIYFKGAWASPFMESQTQPAPFHLANGGTKEVPLMHRVMGGTTQFSGYADFPNAPVPFQMLALNYFGDPDAAPVLGARRGRGSGTPFVGARGAPRAVPTDLQRGGMSFVVLLPRTVDGEAELEKSLTSERLASWIGQLYGYTVEVFLPKFKLQNRYMLNENLQGLGIRDAFVDPRKNPVDPHRADFSGMNDARNLFISNVIHQAFLDVDEKGTEAAAATAVFLRGAGGGTPAPPPPVFRADHPFLFLIRDNASGAILFLGRLANPP